jgi:hypothetical protein
MLRSMWEDGISDRDYAAQFEWEDDEPELEEDLDDDEIDEANSLAEEFWEAATRPTSYTADQEARDDEEAGR